VGVVSHCPLAISSTHVQRTHTNTTKPPQVAFLRGQLQYALQESEQESLELQRQLKASQSDAAALRDSLRAVGERCAEQEKLVVELSSTVQQQQARLQVGACGGGVVCSACCAARLAGCLLQ